MLLGGDVVPFCAQLSAQHNLASATSGVTSTSIAFWQQSMSIMPQSLSPKRTGTPASALPKSITNRNRDVSRVFIRGQLYWKVPIRVNPFVCFAQFWAEAFVGHLAIGVPSRQMMIFSTTGELCCENSHAWQAEFPNAFSVGLRIVQATAKSASIDNTTSLVVLRIKPPSFIFIY